MKHLIFEGEEGRERYEVLYDGLLNTTYPLSTPEARVHSKILDKMEVIGRATQRGGMATFTLNGTIGPKVELEETEYQLMEACLKEARWNSKASRIVSRVLDFFEGVGQ